MASLSFLKSKFRMSIFKIQFILFIILLILWNIFTPILEGADEVAHFCTIDYISHQNKIPDLRSPGCFIWHPPLYYLLLTPIAKVFSLPKYSEHDIKINPRFNLLRKGEYAQFIHSKRELLLRWDSFQFMIHMMRLFSSLSGIGIFLLAWKISVKVFKKGIQRNLSLLLLFNPMFLHIFTTLSNVTLLSLIASIFIIIELIYAERVKSLKLFFFQGILLGLGYLTKTSILGISFAWIYLLFSQSVKFEKSQASFRGFIMALVGFLIVAGWYLYRNVRLYGEVLEVDVVARTFGESHHDLLLEKVGFVNYLNSFILTLFKTFWSGYGALTVRFPETINLVLFIIFIFITFSVFAKFKIMNRKLKICLYYLLSMLFGIAFGNLRLSVMHAKDLFPVYLPIIFLSTFGLIQTSTVLRRLNIKSIIHYCLLLVVVYFFTQFEIVRVLKFIFQALKIEGFYVQETVIFAQALIRLALKLLISIIIYLVIYFLLRRINFSKNLVYIATFVIFGLNLLTLAFSTYLFYFKFL